MAAPSQPMRPIEKVLARLPDARKSGEGFVARCPVHDDREPSLSVTGAQDGRVLLKCFAGCKFEEVVAALGLEPRDLSPDGNKSEPRTPRRGRGVCNPSKNAATLQPPQPGEGLTLDQYAKAKRLPLDFLRALGLSQISLQGRPAVRIPYMAPDATEVVVCLRLALVGDNRFRWKNGSRPCLYGLQRLEEARAAGYVVLCEGPSDPQTLWLHTIPALSLPSASTWREEWAEYFEGIPVIYVVLEADRGGKTVRTWLSASRIRERARLVRLSGAKDPSGL